MVDIINILLLIIVSVALIRICVWICKRCAMISKLKRVVKQHSGELKFLRFPFLPNAFTCEKPDISVKILDTVYLIRLYSGGSKYSLIHFASDKYSVRYVKMASKWATLGGARGRYAIVDAAHAFTVGAKVFVIPPMIIPDHINADEECVEKIILFSPAPNTVSYVTPDKTRITLAFTGDTLFGMKVFTGSSFAAYADRQTRKNDDMMYF